MNAIAFLEACGRCKVSSEPSMTLLLSSALRTSRPAFLSVDGLGHLVLVGLLEDDVTSQTSASRGMAMILLLIIGFVHDDFSVS